MSKSKDIPDIKSQTLNQFLEENPEEKDHWNSLTDREKMKMLLDSQAGYRKARSKHQSPTIIKGKGGSKHWR